MPCCIVWARQKPQVFGPKPDESAFTDLDVHLLNAATIWPCLELATRPTAKGGQLTKGPTVTINIDDLSYDQLIDLNNRVVARLKFLDQMHAHSAMLDFSIGEQVSFQPPGHPVLTGIIAKYNQKTVTVIASTGQPWKVAPSLLSKVKATAQSPQPDRQGRSAKVISMTPKP